MAKGRKSFFGGVGESELHKSCPLRGLLRRPDAAARPPKTGPRSPAEFSSIFMFSCDLFGFILHGYDARSHFFKRRLSSAGSGWTFDGLGLAGVG
jgi:hypothetical protein